MEAGFRDGWGGLEYEGREGYLVPLSRCLWRIYVLMRFSFLLHWVCQSCLSSALEKLQVMQLYQCANNRFTTLIGNRLLDMTVQNKVIDPPQRSLEEAVIRLSFLPYGTALTNQRSIHVHRWNNTDKVIDRTSELVFLRKEFDDEFGK